MSVIISSSSISINMTHGGARQGAGRKASTPDTIAVNWRVSRSAKVWIKTQAMEQGVSIATILDNLIEMHKTWENTR